MDETNVVPLGGEGQTGRLPEEPEVEAALLGALMVSDNAAHRVIRDLRPDHFSEPVHGRIYEAIVELVRAGRPATPLTLKTEFGDDPALQGVGGAQYLFDLAATVITTLNAEDYAATLIDLWQRRQQIVLLRETIASLHQGSIDRVAGEIGGDTIRNISAIITSGTALGKTRTEVLRELLGDLVRPIDATPTGLERLDRAMIGGFHKGRAYGLVGRKKQGKSTFAATILKNLNDQGAKTLVILLEMGAVPYEHRIVARELGINGLAFLDQKARHESKFLDQVHRYAHQAADSLFYVDRPGMTFDQLQNVIHYYKFKHDIEGVVVDYMQLLRGRRDRQTGAEFMDDVAQWFAEAVKKLDIWALVLAQMNQDGNVRGGEGMRLAFDQVYALEPSAAKDEAYLPMWESRYTPAVDIGTKYDGAYKLSLVGPHFEELYDPDTPEKKTNLEGL